MKTTVLGGIRVLDLSTGPVGGFATTVTAWVSSVQWNFGNGDSVTLGFLEVGAEGPPAASTYRALAGSEDDPADTYTYNTKGQYDLTLEVTWSGAFELFDAGGTSLGAYPLDPYVEAETITYQVIEIRSVITR